MRERRARGLLGDHTVDLLAVEDILPAQRAAVLSFPDPLLDAFRVEEMLLVAVEACDVLTILEGLPANNALLLAMKDAGPPLELADGAQD